MPYIDQEDLLDALLGVCLFLIGMTIVYVALF